jgi:hypothetical protein
LEELEDEVRVPASNILERRDHVVLVVAARRRLRLAAAALRAAEHPRHRLLRQLLFVGGVVLKGVVLVSLGAAFLVRLFLRSMRGVLRLVFAFRAI